ncbi:MAG: hypothetical protein ACRC33_08725 [Gemmataceae bacterium]
MTARRSRFRLLTMNERESAFPDGTGVSDPGSGARQQEPAEDPLDQAAHAILLYLADLTDCREICLRHRTDVGVSRDPHALHLVAAAERTPEGGLARMRSAVEVLPSAGRWQGLQPPDERPVRGEGPIARHVLWEEEPLLVRIIPKEFGLLRVELVLPRRHEASRLPLRAAASALRCLECLLPPDVARPLPLAELADDSLADLWDSLRRATPENLPSRHCIWPDGAVQHLIPPDPLPPDA